MVSSNVIIIDDNTEHTKFLGSYHKRVRERKADIIFPFSIVATRKWHYYLLKSFDKKNNHKPSHLLLQNL